MYNGVISNAAEVQDKYQTTKVANGTALAAAKVLMAAAVTAADADSGAAQGTIDAVDAAGAAIAALQNA